MSDILECLKSLSPNFTDEMYYGNAPEICKGHKMVDGGVCDRWHTKYGYGESYKGKILTANFNINEKISIDIIYNCLWIQDMRYIGSCKSDIWEYINVKGMKMPCWSEKHLHSLEPEKIEKILNTKIKNCKFWDMVQARARELYSQGMISSKDIWDEEPDRIIELKHTYGE